MTDVVERARAALEGVTEGPWLYIPGGDEDALVVSESEREPNAITVGGVSFHPGLSVAVDLRDGDAEFIAAAPDLIAELVAEVEKWRAAAVYAHDDNGALQAMTAERDEYRAEVERLRQQRTITTTEQLDALPAGAVIRTHAVVYAAEPRPRIQANAWVAIDDRYRHCSDEIVLPARLLWLPEWGNA